MAEDSYLENAYSLIIGISEYKDPRIPGLKYTHADAEGIFKLLTDPKKLGLSKDKIKILLDRDATQFNIKNAISSWLFKNADKDSVVFIFFAGHGGVEEDRLGIEKDHLAKYLLPYDTVLEDFYSSALSNRDFNELLLTIRSKKLVIFMDSCYSGGVSERKARDVKIAEDPYQKLAEGEGRIVIAASQPDQRSFEDSRIGHGVFTNNLLEALSGKADLDNDGYVTVLDAYKYVQDAVPRDAMKLAGGKQEPILRGDITKDFVISIDRERFENIEKEKVLEEKLGILQNFYDDGKLSGKQYEYLREILKIEPGELKDKNKKIEKRINDLLSGNISIPTFLEDLEGLEPELFVIPEKKRQEQERLRRQREEEDRIQKEKEREKAAKEAQLKTQEMANRLELERQQGQKEEEDRHRRQREEIGGIQREHEEEPARMERKAKSSGGKWFFAIIIISGVLALGWYVTQGSNSATPMDTPSAGDHLTNSIGMEFVLIPKGEFDMGSPESEGKSPVHQVIISNAFYMGEFEVTQKQWRDVMETNPSYFKGDNLPVESVLWDDVQEFIKKLNKIEGVDKYRLPSEAEWEYAARAGTKTRFSFGDDFGEISKFGDYAWYKKNSGNKTHDVGQKKPNPWGLYDIHGNVKEWVQDIYHYSYNGAPTDGSAWESTMDFVTGGVRVIRDCSWSSHDFSCESADRDFEQNYRRSYNGFRLVRDL